MEEAGAHRRSGRFFVSFGGSFSTQRGGILGDRSARQKMQKRVFRWKWRDVIFCIAWNMWYFVIGGYLHILRLV